MPKRKLVDKDKDKDKNSDNNCNHPNSMWNSSSASGAASSSRSKKTKSSSSWSTAWNESSAEQLFLQFADDDDAHQSVNMEGISKFCEQLSMDPLEDVRILVLLWKMGAKDKPGTISKTEWMAGCQSLSADRLDQFQGLIPSLDTGFLDKVEFKLFYKFCFQFNRQGTHKTLDQELAIALMALVLKDRLSQDRLMAFFQFLELHTTQYSHITLDQWCSFLDFCLECDDLSTYDEVNSAWPVLIDEFVEYLEQQGKGHL